MTNHVNIPVASPMFILRNVCEKDFFGSLRKLKEIGFDAVEFLGFFGETPENVAAEMKKLGLTPLGDHVPYSQFMDDAAGVFTKYQTVGCRFLTISGFPEEVYTDLSVLDTVMENVGRFARMASEYGITLLFHNHAAEMGDVFGIPLVDRIMDHPAAKELCLEPDLGWMSIAGADPIAYLIKYRDRCPVIHFKDYYMDSIAENTPADAPVIGALNGQRGGEEIRHFEFRPNGYGVVNTPLQLSYALACNPQFLVTDHDLAYDRDSFEDLKLSLDYIRRLLAIHPAR